VITSCIIGTEAEEDVKEAVTILPTPTITPSNKDTDGTISSISSSSIITTPIEYTGVIIKLISLDSGESINAE
jgi:hypothetical protein